MEIVPKTIDVYVVAGKEFLDREEAEQYEKELMDKLKYVYYVVSVHPDLTEGRGYQRTIIVAVEKSYNDNTLIHFLCQTYGKPLEFAQGVKPVDNWGYSKGKTFETLEGLKDFLETKRSQGIGDYRRLEVPDIYYVDTNGNAVEVVGGNKE